MAGNLCLSADVEAVAKVIKRRAYDYRDEEYFLLKIKPAFPLIDDQPKKGRIAAASSSLK